ncbi:MAG: hypothetical protein AAGA81_18605 [Acidobacteriota bacterium]
MPTEPGSLAPALLQLSEGRVVLSWLQQTDAGDHELRYGTVEREGVHSFEVAGRAEDLFANWADRPGLHALAGGGLAAHWLRRLGEGTYAYGAELLPLEPAGEPGTSSFWLHDDTSPTEHGFVTSVASLEATHFFWLDGRAMLEQEPMTLRAATADVRGAAASELLDARVCECCPTDVAVTSNGPVVVYRDRSLEEIRDISIVRRVAGTWTAPRPVASDGWRIEGCPVNGPGVDAAGDRVAVAWFTAADDRPRVQLALSADAGDSFAEPLTLDAEKPVGRVDLQIVGDLVHVSWLGRRGGRGVILLATVPLDAVEATKPRVLATSSLGRSAGYPRIRIADGHLLLAWVEEVPGAASPESRVRLSRFPLDGVRP